MTTIKPTVYIDSCLIIDLVKVKRNAALPDNRMSECWFVERIMEQARDHRVRLITSTFSLVECLRADENHPTPIAPETKKLFEDFLWSGALVELVPFDPFVAQRARDIRWVDNINIKNADAVHIATALIESATEFLTTDDKLKRRFPIVSTEMARWGMTPTIPSLTSCLPKEDLSADLFPPDAAG